jgi:hypothetical protein
VTNRPILLNSCARAATAAEARFRIDVPISPSRATRIVALDGPAAEVVGRVAARDWNTARFYSCPQGQDTETDAGAIQGLRLRTMDGEDVQLVDELDGVDATVMVAATPEGSAAAATIGAACTVRGIMTAGLVVTAASDVGAALTALRPYARVLMVPADEEDLTELLRAIRA